MILLCNWTIIYIYIEKGLCMDRVGGLSGRRSRRSRYKTHHWGCYSCACCLECLYYIFIICRRIIDAERWMGFVDNVGPEYVEKPGRIVLFDDSINQSLLNSNLLLLDRNYIII